MEKETEVTYNKLKSQCSIARNIFDRHLRALFNQTPSRSLILKQHYQSPSCTDDEILKLNPEFTSVQLKRSFIPQITNAIGKKEAKKTESINDESKNILKERIYITEALIMKIMKVK